MCRTYQKGDSSSSSSSSGVETELRPLQVTYILQFSGATSTNGFSEPTSANGFSGDAGASTSRGDAGASTSREDSGASTPSEDSGANGFYGPAGAAAMVLVKYVDDPDEYAAVLHRFRQGLGNQTINVADYRGLILGLTETIKKGYTEITVLGNSELVVNQFQGLWEIDDPELTMLCAEAVELSKSFDSFSIYHIHEDLCGIVDDEATRAISLPDGQMEEEPQPPTE